MPRETAEIQADVEELKQLLASAQRPHVKDALLLDIRKLESEISLNLKNESQSKQLNEAGPKKVQNSHCYDVKLSTYAWDQSEKFVKLFVTLPEVQTLSPGNVSCSFSQRSVHLEVKELAGKNYTFAIKHLYDQVEPSKSHWKVKTDMVVIFLAKNKTGHWSHITADEKKSKESSMPKLDKDEDPNQGLMKLLKQMYEEGDDEMKRSIAKSWTESRNKQTDLGDLF